MLMCIAVLLYDTICISIINYKYHHIFPSFPPNSCRWAHPPISSFSRLYLTTRDWWKSPFHHQLHSRADGEIHSTPGATILACLQVTIMVNPKVSWKYAVKLLLKFHFLIAVVRISASKYHVSQIYGCHLWLCIIYENHAKHGKC